MTLLICETHTSLPHLAAPIYSVCFCRHLADDVNLIFATLEFLNDDIFFHQDH